MGKSQSKHKDNREGDVETARALQIEQRRRAKERDKILQDIEVESMPVECLQDSKSNTLRIIVVSDTHNKAAEMSHEIPPGDVFIHCGDFTDFSTDEEIQQFECFLQKLPHKHKLVIGGNHDSTILECAKSKNSSQTAEKFLSGTSCSYVDNKMVEIGSVRIYGVPWIKGDVIVQREIYNQIPEDLDILITHAPPLGYGDVMIPPKHSGDQELLKIVRQKKPKFHVFGHAHEGYGIYKSEHTIFINAAICTRNLDPARAPIVIDINKAQDNYLDWIY